MRARSLQLCLNLCNPQNSTKGFAEGNVAHQAPLFMGFSRQEYWSRLPFPSPGDLPKPGIEPGSPSLEADALTSKPVIAYFINFKKTALIFKSHQIRSDQSLSRVRLFATP